MLLAGLRLRLIVVLQPDTPRAFRKAGTGGVVLARLGHELLEVTAEMPPTLAGSVRLRIENLDSHLSITPPSTVRKAS